MESPSRFEIQVQKQPNAAREKGFNFDDARLMRGGWRNEPNPECCKDVSYEILNVLEFNSTRKRQSVVCRYPDGRLVLYCKVRAKFKHSETCKAKQGRNDYKNIYYVGTW
ncbi:hypothetical protein ACS0TY_026390 [Phlomoides rotata]